MTITEKDLLGAWELEEMYSEDEDGTRTHPMGRDARGMIMYTGDHHMSAVVHVAERFLPADRPSDEERAEAFSSYFSYAGTWSLADGAVTHQLLHALDPNMAGIKLERAIALEGPRMTFTGYGPHGNAKNVIVWKRAG